MSLFIKDFNFSNIKPDEVGVQYSTLKSGFSSVRYVYSDACCDAKSRRDKNVQFH